MPIPSRRSRTLRAHVRAEARRVKNQPMVHRHLFLEVSDRLLRSMALAPNAFARARELEHLRLSLIEQEFLHRHGSPTTAHSLRNLVRALLSKGPSLDYGRAHRDQLERVDRGLDAMAKDQIVHLSAETLTALGVYSKAIKTEFDFRLGGLKKGNAYRKALSSRMTRMDAWLKDLDE